MYVPEAAGRMKCQFGVENDASRRKQWVGHPRLLTVLIRIRRTDLNSFRQAGEPQPRFKFSI
jgi:hypothetical protein